MQNAPRQIDDAKSRGAFFTPPAIAEFLASWAICGGKDRVLEPSCGDAGFLIAAAAEQAKLGTKPGGDLVGIEIHAPSVAEANARLSQRGINAQVIRDDFLDFSTDQLFDVVLGNPPFIRYQSASGEARIKGITAALRQGVRLNKLASVWAAFVVHACSFLKPEGRIGFVLPAELMSVNYASSVRSYLLGRFSSLKIVTFETHVFPGVQEEIVLLLASGSGSSEKFELFQAKDLNDLEGALGKRWPYFKPRSLKDKWTHAFIPEDVLTLYRGFDASQAVEQLGSWGRAYLGCVTGANGYFLLSEATAGEQGLGVGDLKRVLPPGSSHLKGLELSKTAWGHLRKTGHNVFLFSPASNVLSRGANKYIAAGEEAGVEDAYKCRVRTPWWRVPIVEKPNLFVSYMTHDGVRLIANTAGVEITNSHYGFRLAKGRKRIGMNLLPIAAINSLTLLGSEMEGRSYGGGLLKMEPREVEKIPLPSLSLLTEAAADLEAIKPQVAIRLRSEKLQSICQSIDDILLRNGMGLSQGELRDLRRARQALFERRVSRNKRGR